MKGAFLKLLRKGSRDGRRQKLQQPPEAVPAQPPSKRGRPKGSKNRKTLERERMALMNAGATSKRGRGRPRKDGT